MAKWRFGGEAAGVVMCDCVVVSNRGSSGGDW